MAARATLRENQFSQVQLLRILCKFCRSARGILQFLGNGALQEKQSQVHSLLLSRQPVGRVLPGYGDFYWRGQLPSHKGIEVEEPLLAEESYVEIDAIESAEAAHRIGPVLQNARREHRRRRHLGCCRRLAKCSGFAKLR